MNALPLLLTLGLAGSSLRLSVDRVYLPGESGENQPTAHLVARGAREVEVSLYRLHHPLRSTLGLRIAAPPAVGFRALRRELGRDWRTMFGSLVPAAQALVRRLESHLSAPLGILSAPDSAGEVNAPDADLVQAWLVPTTDTGWNYQELPLGSLEAGEYEIDARAGGENARALLSVSRLALLAEGSTQGTSILATDAAEGRPLAGVELFGPPTEPNGFPASLGKTGSSGLWTSMHVQTGPIVGRWEGNLARVVVPFPPSRGESGRTETGAVFLDRTTYVDGETVHLWCLLRDREAGSWKIPEEEDARLELVDPAGTVLLQQAAEISALGVVSGGLELPRGLPAGWYQAAVAWGTRTRAASFRLRADKPSELSPTWAAPPWTLPGRPFDARVSVVDRLGRPVPGVAIHWSAATRELSGDGEEGPSEPLGEGSGVSSDDGRLTVSLEPGPEGMVVLQATVEDSAGRIAETAAKVPRVLVPVLISVQPERRLLRPGRAGQLSIDARTLEGEPFGGSVRLEVIAAHSTPGGESARAPLLARAVELDAHGHASVSLPGAPAGYLDVRASLPGIAEPLARATVFVTETGGDIPTTPDRLELVLDRREYVRGDDLRVLMLTPFESGLVLVGLDPAAGPADQIVAVRGYSGEAHLKVPASGGSLRLVAAALSGGTLYRATASVPLAERPPSLALRLFPERRPGDRAALSIAASDPDGHAVPAALAVWASQDFADAPPLSRLLAPDAPGSVWLAASSGAGDSSPPTPGGAAPRTLQPYGPGDPAGEEPAPAPVAQLEELNADDSGRAGIAFRVPTGANRISFVARGVGGPALFGERSVTLPLAVPARVAIDAPDWVRTGDRFFVDARAGGEPGAGCPTLTAAGAAADAGTCEEGVRHAELVGGAADIELAALAPSQKFTWRHEIRVVQATTPQAEWTAARLANEIAAGLSDPTASEWSDLACAAVRALGALPALREPVAAAAIARLFSRENLTGGFGPPEGELRRDVAALRGLTALRRGGVFVDEAALGRLGDRARALARDDGERARVERALEAHPERRRRRLPEADLPNLDVASAGEIADWLEGHRPRRTGASALLERIAALLPAADPLDHAELAASLAALPADSAMPGPARLAVARRFLVVRRQPWTRELLETDEEPGEPTLRGVQASVPLDAEVEVTLSADAPGPSHLACLRDFPPAGLSPIGQSDHLPRGLALCGRTNRGRLELSYLARAVRAGRFVAPGPVASLIAGPGPASWVEVSP